MLAAINKTAVTRARLVNAPITQRFFCNPLLLPVTKLAANCIGTLTRDAINHHATTNAGAENHAKHNTRPTRCTCDRFGKGKAIRVIRHAHTPCERALKIRRKRSTVQAH